MDDLERLRNVKQLCCIITKAPRESQPAIKNLHEILTGISRSLMQHLEHVVMNCLFTFWNPKNHEIYSEDHKRLVVDTLTELLSKVQVKNEILFFNIYGFLLNEIYDHTKSIVANIHEEYKLSIMQCMCTLTKALSWDLLPSVYTKQNATRLSQMLHVAVEISKKEKLRSLRVSAIHCLMAMARVHDADDMSDLEIRNNVANIFMLFLPGIAAGLKDVALEDEKAGHKVINTAIKAWGRIVTLLMRDYKTSAGQVDVWDLKRPAEEEEREQFLKYETVEEFNDRLKSATRTPTWFKQTDVKLQKILQMFVKITNYNHPKIRLELAEMCSLLIDNCSITMQKSLSSIIEIIIILSEDEDEQVRVTCERVMGEFSTKMSSYEFISLLENLEDSFYNNITSLPRIFNNVDESLQLRSLHLLIGHIKLFGKPKLKHVLHSPTHLKHLLSSLIHISELEKADVSLLEECTLPELEIDPVVRTPWKQFVHFREDAVKNKLFVVFRLFSQLDVLEIVFDYLLNVYLHQQEHKKEATLFLNEMLADASTSDEKLEIITSVICTYIESNNWYLALSTDPDEYGDRQTLAQVQSNVLQICLQLEGLGKLALVLKEKFEEFLLRTLYLVLERAGSGIPLLREAGLLAVSNISTACGCKNITELINRNSDYFSFHVSRKLKRINQNYSVLNVLAVVMRFSNMDVLPSISGIVDGSCDEFQDENAVAFLRVFNIFIKCLMRWLEISARIEPIKSKAEKLSEMENFKVSNISYDNDFSDEIMGKTAEEMYKEDLEKGKEELENELNNEDDVYKKPEAPTHIKLAVAILKRSLNFLPFKSKPTKVLVLEILNDGLEVIKDWEDELLPVVHLIWSPLVGRFKEKEESLLVNLSLQLLATLARLSKDFIRMRTSKEVLPAFLQILTDLAKKSYLKDKGSAYRYTQDFKLQLSALKTLARILIDLESGEDDVAKAIEASSLYLSDKQPLTLQADAVEFFNMLILYDKDYTIAKLVEIQKVLETKPEYHKNIMKILNCVT